MSPDWTPLRTELARWETAGLNLPIWWRDDDAIAPSAALDRLAALSRRHGLAVHLAVIPADAGPALAEYLAARHDLIPVVHGWAHQNHAPAGEKKAEFGAHRTAAVLRAEAGRGLRRLRDRFQGRLRPMFVPPWNRIAPDLIPDLPGLGFTALSTFTPRAARLAAPGLIQVNTHLDPIHWKGSRGLADPDDLVARIARQLADRREGRADAAEPYGLLTHHLAHDSAIWQFTDALLGHLMQGPVTPWTTPPDPRRPET